MLKDFDATDQVVPLRSRIEDRVDPAVRLDVLAYLLDGVTREVKAARFHASITKRFDQHADCAPDVEHGFRLELADDPVRERAVDAQQVLATPECRPGECPVAVSGLPTR